MPRLIVVAAILAACSPSVDPTNPYDPETPPELQAKATVRGTLTTTVLASAEGLPVALRAGGVIGSQVSTGPGGSFVFGQLVPGAYQVETQATGFMSQSIAVTLSAGDDLDLGEIALVPLGGASAATLIGTVTLEGRADGSGTLVEALGKSFTALTDGSGGFRLTVIPGDYSLRFSHADFLPVTTSAFTVTAGEEYAITETQLLSNPATVAGHVDGELPTGGAGPLVDALVTLDGTSITGVTNAAGDFTLTGIPSGSYLLRVVKSGYEGDSVPVLNLVGGELRSLDAPLSLELSRGAITGVAALADSPDAAGILVELVGTGRALVTGSDGAFTFSDLLVGTYEVAARKDGYAPQNRTGIAVTAGGTQTIPLPITLSRQGGTVSIAEAPYATSPSITLQLSASGVSHYRASEDPAFGGAAWAPFTVGLGQPFLLADADGEHVVYVQFATDAAGSNPSAVVSASLVLDRVAPVAPALAIGDGSGWSRTVGGLVGLTLSAQDLPAVAGGVASGLDRMELVNGSDFSSGALSYPYNTSATWLLASPTSDGPKAVSARFVDRAGNVSAPVTALVTLDTLAPSSPSVAVAGPDPARPGETNTPIVTVSVSASDANGGVGSADLFVRLANTSGFVGAAWQPFEASLSWLLGAGDGDKIVWAQFMDPAGNVSLPVSATIHLDTSGPGAPALSITEGDSRPTNGQTRIAAVTLTLSASGTPVEALIAENPALTGGTLVDLRSVPLPTTAPFTLGGLGPRTLWVRYYDAAGNASELATASVTLDQTPPANLAPTLTPSGFAPTTAITLTPPNAGLEELQLAGAGVAAAGAWLAPSWGAAPAGVAIPVTLTAGDGAKAISVTYRDLADNSTVVSPSLSVTLDGAAPTAVAFTVTGRLADGLSSATYAATPGVTLDLSGQGDGAGSGVAEMMVSNDATFAGAAWQTFVGSSAFPWMLSPGDGLKTVYAKFRDRVGNTSGTVLGSITLAETPPTGGSLVIEDGAVATSKSTVSLDLTATGATEMLLTVDGAAGSWVPFSATASAALLDPDQTTKVITVRSRNAARVEGAGASASVWYDHTPPTAGTLSLLGTLGNGATSTSYSATAAIVAQLVPPTSDAVEMALVQATTATTACSTMFGTPLWQPAARNATFVLTGGDGAKRVCALFRDDAGNYAAANAVADDLTLDTTAPTNPSFTDLSTIRTNAWSVTGTLVVASTDPAPNTGVTYQCYGSPSSPTWTDCAPAGMVFTFWLTPNAPNVVGVRARDGAHNVSAGTTVQVIQDAVAPFPPNVTAIRTTRDSLTLTWDPSADADVDRFLVYYGNAAGDTAGTGAAQGPSPIPVRAAGTGPHTLTLTGLVAGMPYYVAVEAVDLAGNRSGLSGQRVAVPNKVNPRLLSAIGGQSRAVATLADAGSGKVFAYLAQNQGIVQMDVTSEAAVPQVVGRAFVPDFVPDPIEDPGAAASRLPSRRGGPPAVIACGKTVGAATVQGHCVIMAGSTLEGDYRGDPDGYRAPAPVVFFPLNGTNNSPALGSVETTLPVRPHWVLAGKVDGQQLVFALEKGRIVAFSLDKIAFPRILSEASLPGGIGTFVEADLNGSEMYFYAAAVVPGYARLYPPAVWWVDLTDAPYGDMYPYNLGSLYDLDGFELGDGYFGQATPHPAFDNGIYVAYKDPADSIWYCSYDPWDEPWPKSCVELVNDPDVDILEAAAGSGHGYVFGGQGMGAMPYGYQVSHSGLTVTRGGDVTGLTSSAQFGTVADYVTNLPTTTEHLLVVDRDTSGDYNLERWRVSGTTVTYTGNRFKEIQPERFAEQGRFLFAAQRTRIHLVDLSNPMVPRVVTTVERANNAYRKLVAHGRWLYAITENYSAGHGVEIFEIDGSGGLAYRSRVGTTNIPNDVAAMGRWLFVARPNATGILAYDVGNPAAPVLAGSAATGSFVYALDARPATSGGTPYTAVVYAAQSAASPATAALQTYGYAYNSVTPGSSTFAALAAAPVALTGNDVPNAVKVAGYYAAVSTPGSTTVFNVGTPSNPSVQTSTLPVSGPLHFQGGYLVGLAPAGGASGPLFDVYTGTAATSGAVDGSLLYSSCADAGGAGSLAHAGGTYFASCQRNGIATFSVGSADGGRLLKRYDVSDSWMSDSAALAGDGAYSFFGGALYQALDPARLYYASELGLSTGGLSAPGWSATATMPGTRPYAMWMLQQDGITWSFNGEYLSNLQGVEAYETAYPATAWPTRASVGLAGADHVSAQPASDGDWAWVPRSSRAGGSWSRIEVYDLRNPAAFTGAPVTADNAVTFGNTLTALWWARDRLYVGWRSSGAIKVYNARGATLDTTTPARTSIPTIATARTITGITTSGSYLFATYQKDDPALWGLAVLKLHPNNLDGNGYTFVGSLTSNLPLANPVVAGDVLYVSNNLGVGAVDLTPLFRDGTMPSFTSGTVNVDPLRTGPVRFYVDGPFGFLMGGGYRAFDLR